MSFEGLLAQRGDVVDVAEAVVAGRPSKTRTPLAQDVPLRIVQRRPTAVLYEDGRLVADADVLTEYAGLALGQEIDVDGDRWLVAGEPVAVRGRADVRHWKAPVRRA